MDIEEHEARLEKIQEITKQLSLKDFCDCLYACLESSCGYYSEYCENCKFKDCCVMSSSPDTMIGILGEYTLIPVVDNKEAVQKSLKYDKIVKIINEDSKKEDFE